MEDRDDGLFDDTAEVQINKYYEGVAIAFRYAKFIALFITVLFIMLILSFFRDEVSIDNFQYMLKYVTSEDSSYITTQKIHYPTADSKALDLFAGDFVSAGSGGISLYDTNFNNPLDENFTKKLLYKDMVESLVEDVNKPITYEELAKLAIRYSDGVILNSPNIPESLVSYAAELGKPVLPYQEAENYAQACNEFYDKVR
jgi:hypothetical protein